MHNKASNSYKILKQNKVIKFIIISTLLTTAVLFFLIPYITEKYTIKSIVSHSKHSAKQIKLIRSYYFKNVVKDIKQFAPNIEFHYDHWGENTKVPLPATMVHDLSELFSERTGLKYNIYSEYPFSNREDRVLTKFQKDAIKYTKENSDGTYIKRDIVDGVEVIRVAITDPMNDQACVDCHNNHPSRTWKSGKWKVGDQGGVLEVITPIEEELANHRIMRNYIVFLVIISAGAVLFYISRIVMKRERELLDLTDELESSVDTKNKELEKLHKLLDEQVLASKTDINGKTTYVSQALVDVTGYSKNELLNSTHSIIRHPDMPDEIFDDMWETIKSGKSWRGELLNKKKDGSAFWVDAIISPEYDDEGEIIGFNAVRHDISAKKEADHLASHDHLTKLPNRAYFENVLAHAIQIAKRNHSMLAVLFIDLDNFKNINDTLGHQNGDKILILFGERMKRVLRESDTIARIGGDEFTILLEGVKNKTNILHSVKKVFKVLEEPIEIDSHTFYPTASMGIAVYPDDGNTIHDLMKNADNAMYHIKNNGKNHFKFYTKTITEIMERRLEIEEALRNAIENDSFQLVFQPKYNISTQEIIGCEALVRLEDKKLGVISPGEFIPIAEDNRLIVTIGELVLKKACKAFSQWQKMNLPIDTISVNISSIQLQEEDIVNRLIQIVQESNIEPKHIDLELTEHTIMYQTERNIDILGQLREKGFQITIDDFGTGYSSMSYLKKLPIDTIKIDKIFIDELHLNKDDISIIKAIIALAHSLGYLVLAEGIESKVQEEILLENNCIYGQGYLFSKGLIFDDFVAFLKEYKKNDNVINMYII